MYSFLLILHNLIRWGVLLGGLYAITKSVLGLINKREFTPNENRAQVIFVMFCHTQLLIGILLYFVSPLMDVTAPEMGGSMMNPRFRMEHMATNIIAIGLIQMGRTLSKKATEPIKKHRRALIWFSIGLLLILSRIPWQSTPLFRF